MNLSNEYLQAERLLTAAGHVANAKCKMIVIETALVGTLTISGFTATNQATGAALLSSVIPATSVGVFYPPGGGQGWPVAYSLSNAAADSGKATIVYQLT